MPLEEGSNQLLADCVVPDLPGHDSGVPSHHVRLDPEGRLERGASVGQALGWSQATEYGLGRLLLLDLLSQQTVNFKSHISVDKLKASPSAHSLPGLLCACLSSSNQLRTLQCNNFFRCNLLVGDREL